MRSPVLWLAVLLALLCFPIWTKNDAAALTFSIVPNLLGFSIGAMAVVLAFPTSSIFEIIAENGREDSYYLDLTSRFIHFIFVQVLALLIAVVAAAFSFCPISFLALASLIYAVMTAAMTALALFDVALFYNQSQKPKEAPPAPEG